MEMVYSNENSFFVNNIKNILAEHNIETFLKNEFAQGAVGEISAFDAWPELWVVNDQEARRARQIIKAAEATHQGADWTCGQCAETNAASFEVCWRCQSENNQDILR